MLKPLVVGYDGTPKSLAATRWAAACADREHRLLRIVHVPGWPTPQPRTGRGVLRSVSRIHSEAERILEPIDAELSATWPALVTEPMVVVGNVVPVLLREAVGAWLLVLGAGATATQLAAHAECPVVAVPRLVNGAAPVVVGVDGRPHSDAALGFAFQYAATTAAGLVAIRTPDSPATAAISRHRADHPGVKVVTRTVDTAGDALVAASNRAGLLVIGSRGGAAAHGPLNRSVTQAVLHRARCPVAVVR
ncbi:universal stress protein [Kribbella sp. NPDC020789]